MASDLVLRICQVDEDDGGFPSERHISVQLFIGGLYSILGGYHTVSQMKTFYDMTPAEQNQLDIFLGKINSATTVAAKLGRILRFKAILNFWEQRNDLNLAGYDTPDDIELQLSEIDQGF